MEPVVAKFAAVFHPPRNSLAVLLQLIASFPFWSPSSFWYYFMAKKATVYMYRIILMSHVSVFYFTCFSWGTLPCGSHLLMTWARSVGKCKAKSCICLQKIWKYRSLVKVLKINVGRRMSSLVRVNDNRKYRLYCRLFRRSRYDLV